MCVDLPSGKIIRLVASHRLQRSIRFVSFAANEAPLSTSPSSIVQNSNELSSFHSIDIPAVRNIIKSTSTFMINASPRLHWQLNDLNAALRKMITILTCLLEVPTWSRRGVPCLAVRRRRSCPCPSCPCPSWAPRRARCSSCG
jgi:hypothetical protein